MQESVCYDVGEVICNVGKCLLLSTHFRLNSCKSKITNLFQRQHSVNHCYSLQIPVLTEIVIFSPIFLCCSCFIFHSSNRFLAWFFSSRSTVFQIQLLKYVLTYSLKLTRTLAIKQKQFWHQNTKTNFSSKTKQLLINWSHSN